MEDILEAILPFFLGGLALIMLIGLLIRGKKMIMYHPTLNITIVKRRGFSYTCCFFGPLVPLVRGHIAGFFSLPIYKLNRDWRLHLPSKTNNKTVLAGGAVTAAL